MSTPGKPQVKVLTWFTIWRKLYYNCEVIITIFLSDPEQLAELLVSHGAVGGEQTGWPTLQGAYYRTCVKYFYRKMDP